MKLSQTMMCIVLGHKYRVEERYSLQVRKVRCIRCHQAWGMHDGVEAFVPWDEEIERASKMLRPDP